MAGPATPAQDRARPRLFSYVWWGLPLNDSNPTRPEGNPANVEDPQSFNVIDDINEMAMRHHVGESAKYALFADLDEEKLLAARDLLIMFRDNPQAHSLVNNFVGFVSALLVERHGFCAACGTNHTDPIERYMEDQHNHN